MADSRASPPTRRHPANDSLLDQTRVDPFSPHALGKTPHRLGGQRRNPSTQKNHQGEKLLDQSEPSRSHYSEAPSRPITQATNRLPVCSVRAGSISLTALRRGYCDASFKSRCQSRRSSRSTAIGRPSRKSSDCTHQPARAKDERQRKIIHDVSF